MTRMGNTNLESSPASEPSGSVPPSFPVVGVGASAGGLEALEQLFVDMPEDIGMAFVVIQHLSPDFKSLMTELLARKTKLPVQRVEDGVAVQPNHIYLLPPKKEMIISGGRLLLSDKDPSKELTLPIDVFLRSLAGDMGKRAVAIILSGSGSDGSRGVREIHDEGGLVIVQEAETAKFDGMPKSTLETGVADLVLPPELMPQALVEYGQNPHRRNLAESLTGAPVGPRGISKVLQMLQQEFGIDFSSYKPNTVTRRIERRLQLAQSADLEEYIQRLSSTPEELNALYRDLLIGVTRFFRDEDAFDQLERKVLPELIGRLSSEDELRLWVAGCATGEEPYSLAILVREQLEAMNRPPPHVKIFATDVHKASLEVAAQGVYSTDAVEGVTKKRIEKYFNVVGKGNYQVTPDIRQLVVFASHDLLKDPPFTRVDLITCRNFLIYLQPLAQKKVLSLFHFALKRGGVLMLGPSENPSPIADELETLDAHWKLYKKQRDVRLPAHTAMHLNTETRRGTQAPLASTAQRISLGAVMSTYDALLQEHMPPSLLVSENRELVHTFGGAGRYLRVKDGRPSSDVLDLVDPELKMALTGALQRAAKDREVVAYNGVTLETPEGDVPHKLLVKPVLARDTNVLHLLVTLEPMTERPSPRPPQTSETEFDIGQISKDQLQTLESELRYTKENLQATIEELETSNEELQATNEELVASNEELQSTNEELQSVNEELYTVNAEYQKKITELTELTNDMDNLLSSTDVGTIFLDTSLCIRKFTPKIAETFSLQPQDLGRHISDFTSTLKDGSIVDQLETLLETGEVVEREVEDRDGNWFFLRLLPYRAKGLVAGAVLTLIDINTLKRAENALFRERYLLESLMGSVQDCIYFKDFDGRFVRLNAPMARRLGAAAPQECRGKTAHELLPKSQADALVEGEDRVLKTGEAIVNRQAKYVLPDGRNVWMVTTTLPLFDQDRQVVGTFGIARDVTQSRLAEERIREDVRRRDQFLAMLSHELRNPLGAIINAIHVLERGENGDNRQRAREVIERQSAQMARLLDDLLDVSRVTQNKIELRREVFDFRDAARDALDATRSALEGRNISLRTKISDEPLWINGDPSRVQQIHVNLLSNAAKYTPTGGQVDVSVEGEDGEVVLKVRDTGAGMSDDMLDAVFDLFYQSGKTLDRSDGGMGVGLTLAKSLVQMHGGQIRAISDGPGLGSEFEVRLPRSSAPSAGLGKRKPKLPASNGKRVVIVEDNIDSADMLSQLLEMNGFQVSLAADGKQGLQLILDMRPPVALIDIGLPGMDGFEVARKVRSELGHDQVYLVALTGYGQPSDREAAADAGFDEHLVKPLDPELLARILEGKGPSAAGAAGN